jgi:hypothetical protein
VFSDLWNPDFPTGGIVILRAAALLMKMAFVVVSSGRDPEDFLSKVKSFFENFCVLALLFENLFSQINSRA